MYEPTSIEDKVARILAGDFSLTSSNNSLSSRNQKDKGSSEPPSPAPQRTDEAIQSPRGSKGIAQTTSFLSDEDENEQRFIQSMEINEDENVSVRSSPTLSENEAPLDLVTGDSRFRGSSPPVIGRQTKSTESMSSSKDNSGRGGKVLNPKGGNDDRVLSEKASSFSSQVPSTVVIQVSSPVDPKKKKATTPTTTTHHASNDNLTVRSEPGNTTPVRKTAFGTQLEIPSPVERVSPHRSGGFSTPNSNSNRPDFSSPKSASSSVGVGERSVVVAVRVRPFNQYEKNQKARRTISKAGLDLVIVNPKAFDAEPDTIATAAIAIDHNPWAHAFRFDQCLWSYDPVSSTSAYIDQVGVHESVGYDIVDQALNGISCSCFAYGHTSTGKTYTLFGKTATASGSSSSSAKLPMGKSPSSVKRQHFDAHTITEDTGLVPRVFYDIIHSIKSNHVSTTNSRIFLSYLEIYNEKVVDLLSDNLPSKHQIASNNSSEWGLKVREHSSYGVYVEGLKKFEIFSVEDMFALINKGNENRTTSQTMWNTESSRSHAIVTLELSSFDINSATKAIEDSLSALPSPMTKSIKSGKWAEPSSAIKHQIEKSSKAKDYLSKEYDNFKTVRVQMVDLAGSEKDIMREEEGPSSGSNSQKIWSGNNYDTTPNKINEAALDKEKLELKQIRRSLATLGFIIQSLGRGASLRSLPYRDSKITFLLRDALRGSNHTTMIATVSPAHIHYEETLATLRYAEKLCVLGKRNSINAGTTSIALPLRDDRPQLIEEFRRYHSDVETVRKSNLAARQLLQFTIADPQQRIARLTQPDEHPSVTPSAKKKSGFSNADLTFTSPIDGKMKKIRDLTTDDLDTLQSTYRTLQGQVIELQIDLDAVKTDRDTLLIEVRSYKEQLGEVEHERKENGAKIANYIKSLRLAEKELNENRMLLKRKDEHIERLINELNETKQSKLNAEQAYHARTKEFLQRFDILKK
jgi:hypothetical protein